MARGSAGYGYADMTHTSLSAARRLIVRQRKKLWDQEKKIAQAIDKLQAGCSHPTPTAEYKGDTGNYDPSANGYWIRWECADCGKRWTTDQTPEEWNKYPNAVKVT